MIELDYVTVLFQDLPFLKFWVIVQIELYLK